MHGWYGCSGWNRTIAAGGSVGRRGVLAKRLTVTALPCLSATSVQNKERHPPNYGGCL